MVELIFSDEKKEIELAQRHKSGGAYNDTLERVLGAPGRFFESDG